MFLDRNKKISSLDLKSIFFFFYIFVFNEKKKQIKKKAKTFILTIDNVYITNGTG